MIGGKLGITLRSLGWPAECFLPVSFHKIKKIWNVKATHLIHYSQRRAAGALSEHPQVSPANPAGFTSESPGFISEFPGFTSESQVSPTNPRFHQRIPGFTSESPGFTSESPGFTSESPGFTSAVDLVRRETGVQLKNQAAADRAEEGTKLYVACACALTV